jgi:putative two-component system response regulator
LAFFGIDSFESYNRRHGSIQGDRTLRDVAQVIKSNIRQADLAARFSGDLCAVIFVDSDSSWARVAAERIRHLVEKSKDGDPTLSAGLATFHEVATNKNGLIHKAMEALSEAKLRGKNRVHCVEKEAAPVKDESSRTILIVDDNPLNVKLLEALLLPLNHKILKAYSGEEAMELMSKSSVDLVLLDIMMPGMDGYEVCRLIKGNENTRMIPVIAVTALEDIESKLAAIESGADDFLTKPPNKVELLARTRSLLQFKKLNDNLTSIENVLFSLAKAVEAKDPYTQGHIERVSGLAVSLGRKLGLSANEIKALRLGGILHDIGKIGIPLEILNKQGPLTYEEWLVMKTHCDVGHRICLPLEKTLGPALDVVRHHHEKLDGSGYPDGLRGEEIPRVAMVMSVVDSYDAMITDRPYRKALSKEETLVCLSNEVSKGKLDSFAVECLRDMITDPGQTGDGKLDSLEVASLHDMNARALPGSALDEFST